MRCCAILCAQVPEGGGAKISVTGESFALRYRLRRTDGSYRWMASRAEPLRDHEGHIIQWYGLCHDIGDQMSAGRLQALGQEYMLLR